MKFPRTLVGVSLALAATLAWSHAPSTDTPRVDARQDRQEQRIDQGAARGSLTPREAGRLERQQTRIDRAEVRAKADGDVTAKERHRLHKAQNAASRDIKHQKHDARGTTVNAGS